MPKPRLFKCSHCAARYHLVEIEVDPSVDVAISCLICDRPLPSRDGQYALKYLLAGGQGQPGALATRPRGPEAKRGLTPCTSIEEKLETITMNELTVELSN